MVATIESERTTSSQTNKVPMTSAIVACIGALIALIWLAVLTNNLNDTRAKLETTQAATRTLQTQVYELTQRTQGHESMLNTPQMQRGTSGDNAQGMPGMGMPGMGMQSMQQPMQQPMQQSTKQQPTQQSTQQQSTPQQPTQQQPTQQQPTQQQPMQQPGGGTMPQQGMGDM